MTDSLSAPEACERAGITYRQLDWWIRNDAIPVTDDMDAPGSGHYRRVPDWYVPRLRLLGEVQRALGNGGNGGVHARHLRKMFDHYYIGSYTAGPITITWTPESTAWQRCPICGDYFDLDLAGGPCQECA
jgi:hypothetical protein